MLLGLCACDQHAFACDQHAKCLLSTCPSTAEAHHARAHDGQRAEQHWQEAERAGELHAGLRGAALREDARGHVHCNAQLTCGMAVHTKYAAAASGIAHLKCCKTSCPTHLHVCAGAVAAEHRRTGGRSGAVPGACAHCCGDWFACCELHLYGIACLPCLCLLGSPHSLGSCAIPTTTTPLTKPSLTPPDGVPPHL